MHILMFTGFACESTPELRTISQKTLLRTHIDLNDLTIIKAYAEAYNQIVNNIISNKKHHKISSREHLRLILKLSSETQNQTTVNPKLLTNEYSFDLIDELLTRFSLRSDDIFIHLDCSYSHVLLQIAAMISCKKIIGIEKNSSIKKIEENFRFWMKWFGKSYSDFQIIEGDFFDKNFPSILKSGNVIFVNNKTFSNDKNHNLKLCFYDLQSGSRIISTKPFIESNNRVTARNINDIDSVISLRLIENLKTNTQLIFYLHTIDYSKIEQYFHRKV
ncbi:unnamed protein product [Adineta steineri]|uniref:Histone-lysine N-methyltransferase, H3 lysine-79 specific n=1 Tax=Adineta steineri TaxID=433720 RepID=A0A818I6T7_9BILA|nr:unnamed protein product [Adineta steineri]CAF3514516.1 unnamed protein product [Adineta steineri]